MNEPQDNLFRQTGRIEYIDIFRAFGIILMVMGHIEFGKSFDHFIHAFHMPMFFFVSGFLYKNKNTSFLTLLCRKAKSLLIPYFVFGFLHFFYYSIVNGFYFDRIEAILLFPNYGKVPICEAIWFLMALFFADIIYFWVSKIENERIVWIVVIAISLTSQIIFTRFDIKLPFALNAAMVGIGLMHAGRAIRKYEQMIIDLRWYQIVVFGVLTGLAIMQSDYVNMRAGTYPNVFILFWTNAISASIIGMNIAKKMKELFKDNLINCYLQSIGRNSIVYVCLNQAVIMLSYSILHKGFVSFNISTKNDLFITVLNLILTLAMLLLLSFLFEKTILRVMIGRFNTKKHKVFV